MAVPDQPRKKRPSAESAKRLPPLLRRAWYGLNQAFRQRITHLEITPDQFSILRWLSEGDPQGLTQRQLTDLMSSDPNTITATLSRMEASGLISRQRHELDRRAHRVKILSPGLVAFTSAKQIALDLQRTVLDVLPAERQAAFLAELELVAQSCAAAVRR